MKRNYSLIIALISLCAISASSEKQTIQKIDKTNIYSQFNTSVKVHFNNTEGEEAVTLLFIFTRTPDNKWFLKSIEAVEGATPELSGWVITKKNLNIAVQ